MSFVVEMAADAPFFCLHMSHALPTLRFLWLLPPVRASSSSSDDISCPRTK